MPTAQTEHGRYEILPQHRASHQTDLMVLGIFLPLQVSRAKRAVYIVLSCRAEQNPIHFIMLSHHLDPDDHNCLHLYPHLSSFVPFSISTLRAPHHSPARQAEAEACRSPPDLLAD